MEDKKITCVEKTCGKVFTFPVNEQIYFKRKGLEDPKRCKPCREKRRAQKQQVDKEWGTCESCGQEQPLTEAGMCGPCTFGEADTLNGNW